MQIRAPILDVLKDFFHHSMSLVKRDFHHRSLAGRVVYGKLGMWVS